MPRPTERIFHTPPFTEVYEGLEGFRARLIVPSLLPPTREVFRSDFVEIAVDFVDFARFDREGFTTLATDHGTCG